MTDIKYPKGFKKGNYTQLAVRFPTKMFDSILARAKREKRDFNGMVTELVKCGELCLSDSDKHEPKK